VTECRMITSIVRPDKLLLELNCTAAMQHAHHVIHII